MLDNGQFYEKLFFDGGEFELMNTIECGEFTPFTYVNSEGKSKGFVVRSALILSYETDTVVVNAPDPKPERSNLIIFPTAGFQEAQGVPAQRGTPKQQESVGMVTILEEIIRQLASRNNVKH